MDAGNLRALEPCPHCHRHVRRGERVCPFCAASVALDALPLRAAPVGRLSRAALMGFVAAVGTGCTALTHETDAGPTDASAVASDGCAPIHGGGDAGYGCPPICADGVWVCSWTHDAATNRDH